MTTRTSPTRRTRTSWAGALALTAATTLVLTGCVAGEDAQGNAADADSGSTGSSSGAWSTDTLNIDFATYNPLSLIVKDQGFIEEALGDDVDVTWTQSAGSNKANELLRAGAVDVGSTAGSAALLARSNGSPIQTIDIYSQPEWSALVVPGDSDITDVADLEGRTIAATTGTDPYFFLLQALDEAGLSASDVTIENLQHADGRAALENGSVDAWSGLDPIMAASEAESGTKLIYRNVDFLSYGFLNATESFLDESPDVAQVVVNAYEKARAWAEENPDETRDILAEAAGIDPAVATTVLDRTHFDVDPVPGADQQAVLEVIAPVLVETGDVASQDDVDTALDSLFEPSFAEEADPS
ncbi:aliphatic sulfonate ABC transporter substrate-binding protein [Frigoribacterium faeni]|uniref:Putative aliphatic sulfonates-binding protein n=1 Tax=Frigoribacterium faeni TaxID=145483 RepID=A0A7W3JHY5_9MICO|nr:aliphatic sulfonate ABC transporter substrate-binding protein [Frigoribacterium faeni]MBA8813158.1 sulfonate transport system substrate-binding protein [Frigoribacterium faeni]BFF14354.1 aliphatic sulfonate ABC transporter substrate-binding protein [Microbacterium flavescens]GEK84387.1 ABC transporter substrate-binding protein [Frigoribacterium faeni]